MHAVAVFEEPGLKSSSSEFSSRNMIGEAIAAELIPCNIRVGDFDIAGSVNSENIY